MSSRSFVDYAYDFYANYWSDAKMSGDNQASNGEQAEESVKPCQNAQGDSCLHAVYVPPEDNEGGAEDASARVYQDKLEALRVMKKYKKARLKTFGTREEAQEYACNGGEKEKNPAVQITAPIDEKPSNFKGPKPQELVAFRKFIESGELETVKKIAWENPRYLVSSGDTPAILQEGCRYNALHIVTAKGQTNTSQMCELILNTVGNPEFSKLLYGDEDSKSYHHRAQILVDLYLNTPDKGLNETPLHFAAKYGLKDIVKVLVSYAQCEKNAKNKYAQTPAEIICSRKCQDDETLKRDIRQLLEEQYYVPVLRSEDNTLQPTIGDPFSPTSPVRPKIIDPMSPRIEVRAFAGPMTKPQAIEFRRKWKTPPRINLNFSRGDNSLNDSFENLNRQDLGMRLQDPEKGLERVGRDLAEECHVPWKEFWPFLNDFADLRCDDGLARIEKYLEGRYNEECGKEKNETCISQGKHSPDGVNTLCSQLESWSLDLKGNNGDSDSDEFFTPPSSPSLMSASSSQCSDSDDEMCMADEGAATFLEGNAPTKSDFDVYNAICSRVDQELYPFIYRWRHEMTMIVEKNDFTGPPSSIRRRLLCTPEKPRISKF